MKKVLAIDVDGVLADLIPRLVETVNECEGDNVSADEINSWNLGRYFKCGNKVYNYMDYSLFRTLPVIKDAQRVVKLLSEEYFTFIVSSATNNFDSLKAKMEWLEEHFPFIPASNIVLCGSKSIIKCDILIDDSPRNLIDVSDAYGILFNAAHNKLEDRFTRAMNWNEIERMLLSNEEE